jgi:glutamate synthase (NADPH/NADH) small chain
MPAWSEERDVFLEMGGHILILTAPVGYVTDARGALTGLKVARTTLGPADSSGRRTPVVVRDSESVLDVGLVVEALGQEIPAELVAALKPLALSKRGLIAVQPGSSYTGVSKVYAGGDLVNGGMTVVRAVTEGMKAAKEIHAALTAK